jgi:hypothetical protein
MVIFHAWHIESDVFCLVNVLEGTEINVCKAVCVHVRIVPSLEIMHDILMNSNGI